MATWGRYQYQTSNDIFVRTYNNYKFLQKYTSVLLA